MSRKSVKYLLPSQRINMGGFPVMQAIPTQQVDQLDPFLLLHHAKVKPLFDRPGKIQGVGPHPHRGFSPVTFVIEGEVHHRDSRGNSQIAKAGEVQWMHAGMGIVHSERPSEELIERRGRQEIVQLWINSPASSKMLVPSYQFMGQEIMPGFFSNDGLIQHKLVAGDYDQQRGRIKSESPLLVIWSKARKDGQQLYRIPAGFNSMLYLIKGELKIHGYGPIEQEHLAIFELQKEIIEVTALTDAEFLLLAGQPLNEPIAKQGPFVMNSESELLHAMRDYQMGKMGILIEDEL